MALRTYLLFCLIASLSSCSSYDKSGRTTFSRGLRRPDSVNRISGSGSAESSPSKNAVVTGVTGIEFAKRIVGGELIRAENGTLVVRATTAKDDLQPIGLTTDAIITASVLNKLGTQPRLKAHGFEVTSTNGVVSIHARSDSVDDAVAVINLTLTVPDVRQVIYAIPTRV
jgi:acyl-coenzyme A thioesterase PaaI-like protein